MSEQEFEQIVDGLRGNGQARLVDAVDGDEINEVRTTLREVPGRLEAFVEMTGGDPVGPDGAWTQTLGLAEAADRMLVETTAQNVSTGEFVRTRTSLHELIERAVSHAVEEGDVAVDAALVHMHADVAYDAALEAREGVVYTLAVMIAAEFEEQLTEA